MFDEFVRVLPDGAFIRVVVGKGNTLSIEGTSESNNRISAYMHNLDSSPKFDGPNLTKVVADDVLGEQGSEFNMSVGVVAKSLDRTDVNADEEASPENGN
jgi:type IV pilus assembly protein PilN